MGSIGQINQNNKENRKQAQNVSLLAPDAQMSLYACARACFKYVPFQWE